MRSKKIVLLNQRYLPRWAVFALDIGICICSFALMFLILDGTPLKFNKVLPMPIKAIVVIGINILFFLVFRTYAGIVRHSTFTDVFKVASASFLTAFSAIALNYIFYMLLGQKIFLTTGVLLYMFFSFTLMLFFRIAVKEVYQYLQRMNAGNFKKKVLIVGMDNQTISLGRALTTESDLPFKLVGFLSENPSSKSLSILGKPVFSLAINKDSLPFTELIAKTDLDGVLIVRDSHSIAETKQIVEACLANNVEVFNVPLVENWNKKEDIQTQIRPIQIEDLLERHPIKIDADILKHDLEAKTILVTGAAGSIGSEIVKQLAAFRPKKIVILDNAESALHAIELYLRTEYPSLNFVVALADVRNIDRLEMIFSKYKFNFVYHAAAYKHVPLMEKNPHEAVAVNIMGTINLANLAVQHGVDKFVMISTDKAVNPTNVMGASKRGAEMYVQSLQERIGTHTKFITTRFGNVLGSNGSVIPYFRKQIANGGPVTVTHKDIIRYFMTISEACQLVLQAGTMGNGGEIYVFDMGKPIKIMDMAENMIRLSGLKPYKDIDIQIVGLRPGEKLYEELLSDTAMTLPTYHPKIMVSKVPVEDFNEVSRKIQAILKATTQNKRKPVVKRLKELVPEYLSQNSEFQSLDKAHHN
ncbi:nucleoside-diphosphate sugar epimerase/dehydratase [Aequorivita sp. SDUM287046]|uniref:Nucleoside-diphosphate sugar epimerase/dehydratase n=1 Tax=Aequorivita aurantiaca TaxID=3053356 RepID=A0ABT8DGU1_9FLAO|nr:nucleoside-diphosphate sugar epimerase/dehydratase [Aequorivita aurantiaca]MDN3723954.1 nucleoside-diphosphate sugar epimerase/dehydratase [Aequorivita aurantiaca]